METSPAIIKSFSGYKIQKKKKKRGRSSLHTDTHFTFQYCYIIRSAACWHTAQDTEAEASWKVRGACVSTLNLFSNYRASGGIQHLDPVSVLRELRAQEVD